MSTGLLALSVVGIAGALFALIRGLASALDHDHRASRARLATFSQAPAAAPERQQGRRHRNTSSAASTRRWLRRAGLKWEPGDLVGIVLASGVVPAAVMILLQGRVTAAAIPVGALGAFVPVLLISRRVKARSSAFNGQVVETLEVVASSLRSGFGFVQSLELAAAEQRDPIASELRQCIREINLGAATDEALLRMVERTADPDLELAINAVVIQRRVGGDLSEVLGNIALMIRERIRIRGEIQTLTAQARMSSWIVGLLPVVLAGVLTLMQPDHMSVLVTDNVGRLLVVTALVLEIVGFALIRRIAAISY